MKHNLHVSILTAVLTLSACSSSTSTAPSTTTVSTSSAPTSPLPTAATVPLTTSIASTQATPAAAAVTSTVEPPNPPESRSATTTIASAQTTSVSSVEDEINADYQTDQSLYWTLVFAPSTENLESRVGEFSVPGQQIFAAVVKGVQDLVKVGDTYVPNSPDLRLGIVEKIELDGARDATLTICSVDNSKRVTPASKSPTGSEIDEDNTGQLAATRTILRMHLASGRWLLSSYPGAALGIWKGQDHCEPA